MNICGGASQIRASIEFKEMKEIIMNQLNKNLQLYQIDLSEFIGEIWESKMYQICVTGRILIQNMVNYIKHALRAKGKLL